MTIRDQLSSSQRSVDLRLTIDPGFVHHRKAQTLLGRDGMAILNEGIRQIPQEPAWHRDVAIDQLYSQIVVDCCAQHRVPTLGQVVEEGQGNLICSIEPFAPCPEIRTQSRVSSAWAPQWDPQVEVAFEYASNRVVADTLRTRLAQGDDSIAVVAHLRRAASDRVVFEPIVMGFPWLRDYEDRTGLGDRVIWFAYAYFENFVEDFDEFARVRSHPVPSDSEPMRLVSEKAFKQCLASILGGTPPKDWGGETSDFFSAHIHLMGRRKTAAFLLKGPSDFRPMTLDHLGKRNDQIVRLAKEPASVLVVQHCHDIGPAVRDTLRAFAVQPGRHRRYCLMDGRDSLRLLQAFGLYDTAVELTRQEKAKKHQ